LLARSELVLARADHLLQRSEPTLDALGRLSIRADRESAVLFKTMTEFGESGLQVMAQAQTALEQLNGLTAPGSPTQRQISLALQELTATARTMRSFTEYLQRNPNALLTGKSGQPR
jgi:paraquat-inducible protein B